MGARVPPPPSIGPRGGGRRRGLAGARARGRGPGPEAEARGGHGGSGGRLGAGRGAQRRRGGGGGGLRGPRFPPQRPGRVPEGALRDGEPVPRAAQPGAAGAAPLPPPRPGRHPALRGAGALLRPLLLPGGDGRPRAEPRRPRRRLPPHPRLARHGPLRGPGVRGTPASRPPPSPGFWGPLRDLLPPKLRSVALRGGAPRHPPSYWSSYWPMGGGARCLTGPDWPEALQSCQPIGKQWVTAASS